MCGVTSIRFLTYLMCVLTLWVQSHALNDVSLTKKDPYLPDDQPDEEEALLTDQSMYNDTTKSNTTYSDSSFTDDDSEFLNGTNNIVGSRNYVGLTKEESKENLEVFKKIPIEFETLTKSPQDDLETATGRTPSPYPTHPPNTSILTSTTKEAQKEPRREDRSLSEDEMTPEERELCECFRKGTDDLCIGEIEIPFGVLYMINGETFEMVQEDDRRRETDSDADLRMVAESQGPEMNLESTDAVFVVSTGSKMKTLNVKNAKSFQVCPEGLHRELTTVSISDVGRVDLKNGTVMKKRKFPLTFELKNIEEDLKITSGVFYSEEDKYGLNLKLSNMRSNNVIVDLAPHSEDLVVSVHNLNSITFTNSMQNEDQEFDDLFGSTPNHVITINSAKNVDMGRQDAKWARATFFNITNLKIRRSAFNHSKTISLDFQDIANLTLEEDAINVSGCNLSFTDVHFKEVKEGGIVGRAENSSDLQSSVVFNRTDFDQLHNMSLNFKADILHFSDITFNFNAPPSGNEIPVYIEADTLYYTTTSSKKETLPRGVLLCEWSGTVRFAIKYVHPEDAYLCTFPTTTTSTTSTTTTTTTTTITSTTPPPTTTTPPPTTTTPPPTTTTPPTSTTPPPTTTPPPPTTTPLPPTTTTPSPTTSTATTSTLPPTLTTFVVRTTAQSLSIGPTDSTEGSAWIGYEDQPEDARAATPTEKGLGKTLMYLIIGFLILGVIIVVFIVAWYLRIQLRTYSWTPTAQSGKGSSALSRFSFTKHDKTVKNAGTLSGSESDGAEVGGTPNEEQAELMPKSSPAPVVFDGSVLLRKKVEPTPAYRNNSFIMDEQQSNTSCSGSRPLTPMDMTLLQGEAHSAKHDTSEEMTSQGEMTSHNSSSCCVSSQETSTLDLYV